MADQSWELRKWTKKDNKGDKLDYDQVSISQSVSLRVNTHIDFPPLPLDLYYRDGKIALAFCEDGAYRLNDNTVSVRGILNKHGLEAHGRYKAEWNEDIDVLIVDLRE